MSEQKTPQENTSLLSWSVLSQDWVQWLLIAAMFVAAAVLYPQLPERIPSHWNAQGELDGTMTKPWGVLFLPLMSLGLYLMLLLVPLIDPRRENYKSFAGSYRLIRLSLMVFFALLYGATLAAALGVHLDMTRLTLAGMGLLIALLGYAMGRIKHNYFVGIRTPWTLANEEVWRETHRMSSKLWIVAGVLATLAAFLPPLIGFIVGMSLIMLASLASVVYSYIAWRKRQ